jgi:hypothetical protein
MFHLRWCLSAVFALANASAFAAEVKQTAPAEPEGMKPLFANGLEGWDGDLRLWSFKDGVVKGQTTLENPARGNTFLIWKAGELTDFDLRLSFKIGPVPNNSGVQFRSKHLPFKDGDANKWVVSGYQAEVEDTPGKAGFLYHEKGRGELCHVGEKVEVGADGKPKVVGQLAEKADLAATYKKGDWNDYIIIAKGNHIQMWLNGYQTVDLTDNDPKGGALSGILALQIHAGNPMIVEFKNVRLKVLDNKK